MVIGTHNGTFHCDEALAVFMLQLTQEFKGAAVKRTRDPEELKQCDVVVDVGAVYEPENKRFDHHQRGFEETFSPNHKTKLSSAGLIYKHFGREVVGKISGCSGEELEIIYQKIYLSFIEGLDGIDNGLSQYPSYLQPAYQVNTDLSSRVAKMNPRWNEQDVDMDVRFKAASEMAGQELVAAVDFLAKGWLPARAVVEAALAARQEECSTGEIIRLSQSCPWQEHFFDLEQEQGLDGLVKYCLYPDSSAKWRIQAAPIARGSFTSRLALPEQWRGVRDDKLSDLAGIPGCIFAHATGFIGGNQTLEGVRAMATKALQLGNDESAP